MGAATSDSLPPPRTPVPPNLEGAKIDALTILAGPPPGAPDPLPEDMLLSNRVEGVLLNHCELVLVLALQRMISLFFSARGRGKHSCCTAREHGTRSPLLLLPPSLLSLSQGPSPETKASQGEV